MNSKTALRLLLLGIVFGSVAVYALNRPDEGTRDPAAAAAPPTANAASVVVTYFTTDVRCAKCRTIEKLSRQAIEEGFPQEVAAGTVLFRVVNTDRPENEHFVDTYEITNKTVIVSHQENGTESDWTNRQEVWLLLDEPDEFFAYVREPVARYLAGS